MSDEIDVNFELEKARRNMRIWIKVQSIIRWIFMASFAITFYLVFTERRGNLLDVVLWIDSVTFLILVISFIVTATIAGKLKKLVRMIKTPSINQEEGDAV